MARPSGDIPKTAGASFQTDDRNAPSGLSVRAFDCKAAAEIFSVGDLKWNITAP